MNRVIKFRAFIDGKMKPVSILYNTPHPSRTIDMDFETMHVNAVLLPAETPVMQYIGLKDKNDKEIYEGDILFNANTESKCQVAFRNGTFCGKRINDVMPNDVYPSTLRYFEIIGNIHENPEML